MPPDRGPAHVSDATRSEDYSSIYYNDAHLGGDGEYGWENNEWRAFFRSVADRTVGITNPATVLDVGCAKGMLVQALREKGVDAIGFDLSEHAIETSHPDVRPHLSVASATEPIAGHYALVTCIEVLEHMSPGQAQQAIDRISEVTDRVLFSSSPSDHREPTHVNPRPTATWAAAFAERGLYRRTDVDLSFLTPWAVLFERADLTVHELAHRYETQHAVLSSELLEKRAALLDCHRKLSEAQAGHPTAAQAKAHLEAQSELVRTWEAEVLDARHQLLTTRDHVVGTEAEVTRLTRDLERLRGELARARKQLETVRGRLKQVRGRIRRMAGKNQQLTRELDGRRDKPSLARRVVRKMRGGAR